MGKLSLRPNRAARERARTIPSSSNTQTPSQISGLGKFLRSRFAQLGIIAAIGGAGYAVVSSQSAPVSNSISTSETSESLPRPLPDQTLSTYQPSLEEDVALTDNIIQRAFEGSNHLKQILAPKLSEIDQELAQKLYETFQLMDINAKNPNNNFARIQMDMKNGRGEFSNASMNYFMFHALPPALAGTAANYNISNRTVEVSPEFDPFNLLDIIIFHHELRHVMQDTALRSSLSTREDFDRYMAFFTLHSENDPQKVLVFNEASAYMYEIETLNVLLDGELKTSILNGNPLSLEYIRGKLHARERQIDTIQLLVAFATSYYTSGSTYRGLTPSFLDTIVATYRRQAGKFDFYETGDFRNPKKWSR